MGRACAALLRNDQGRVWRSAPTAGCSRSPATTATCCSTSCRSACPSLGIEPAANVAEVARKKNIPTLVEFFGLKLAQQLASEGKTADLIIGNNVLAQVPDLNDFTAGMAHLLAPQGVITLEFPHLEKLIDENQFDTIYHEHFSYFSLVTIDRMAKRHGLKVFDVEEIGTHGGSLRVYLCRARRRAVGIAEGHRAAGATSARSVSRTSRPTRASPQGCTTPSASCCRS